jgi:hypothetical protein
MQVAQAAADTMKGIVSGIAGDTAAYKQRAMSLLQEEQSWITNTADNKAIGEANLTNTIRTGFKVGLLNVQRAQAKKRIMQEGFDISRLRQQVLGAATANAAAAGQIGPSVDAVLADIEQDVQESQTQISAEYEQQSDNFDVQLTDILNAGQDALRSTAKINVIRAGAVEQSNPWAAVLGAAAEQGGNYLAQRMSISTGSTSKE